MELLYLESFYGGSHRDVADNVVRRSHHNIELHTLPDRFWKWRMRGAAIWFAHHVGNPERYDLVVTGGMMSIADLRGLWRDCPPVLLYAHETQLSYPAPQEREADLHFAFTDLTNMLCADRVAFNSHTHRDAYLAAIPGFLSRLPEYRPAWAVAEIGAKSTVCYPGIDAGSEGQRTPGPASGDHEPPLIVWNHRWEFDKAPERFFGALRTVKQRGVPFRLALLGESFQAMPSIFIDARSEFADELVHYGYVESREGYRRWLSRSDIVVSTAIQENFGIAVMEAVAHGAIPLLPRRLVYPELFPPELGDFLYDDGELAERLAALIRSRTAVPASERYRRSVVEHARSFAWDRRIAEFDALFETAAGRT